MAELLKVARAEKRRQPVQLFLSARKLSTKPGIGRRRHKKRGSRVATGKMARAMVLRGSKEKTVGGLRQEDLEYNRRGKVVSKKGSAASKATYSTSPLKVWTEATKLARTELKVTGFVAIKKGTPYYEAIQYHQMMLLAGQCLVALR